MHKLGIGIVTTGLLVVLSVFCSASFAEDQGQALIEAAKQGDVAKLQELLKEGADINAKDNDGHTPLMSASVRGHAEVVKALLAKGADINAEAEDGLTALKLALQNNHLEVVKLLKAHGAKE